MSNHIEALSRCLSDVEAVVPEARAWASKGQAPDEPVLVSVAIALGARACSTAARGVERPELPIMLAGAWQTGMYWPLVDVVASAKVALEAAGVLLAENDRWSDEQLRETAEGCSRQLEDRALPEQLRDLVRSCEQSLYSAARYAAVIPVQEDPLGVDWCASELAAALRSTGGAALMASALAQFTRGIWMANFTNRYYR